MVGTELGTSLGVGSTTVLTVEHVLAALAGGGVDNVTLELSGPEPPIRDGSFQDYVHAVASVGVVEQDAPARVIEVKERLRSTARVARPMWLLARMAFACRSPSNSHTP